MLLNSDGVVGTAFEREVVGKDHALPAMNISNAGNDIPRGHALVKACELAESQPGRALVQNFANALSSVVLLAFSELCLLIPRQLHRLLDVLSQLHVQHFHLLVVVRVLLRSRVVVFAEDLHEALVLMRIPSLVYLALKIVVELLLAKTAAISRLQSIVSVH